MTRSAEPVEGDSTLVDARGMRCPWPVLRAARAMRTARHVTLLSDDPVARTDVPELARQRGWQWDLAEDPGTVTRFTLWQDQSTY
jgi:tRNA 2-thiouridine synthesizing protein A